MKKLLSILALIPIFTFSTTGNFNMRFKPNFEFGKEFKHKYSMPYSFKIKMDGIDTLYFGIDGVYNKDKAFGTFDIIGNKADGWVKYILFEGQPMQYDFYLKNTLKTKLNPLTINFGMLFNFKLHAQINENFKYIGELEYAGNTAFLNPDHVLLNNTLELSKDNLGLHFNVRRDFSGDTHVFNKNSLLYKDAQNKAAFSIKDSFKTYKYIFSPSLDYSKYGINLDMGLNYTFVSSPNLFTNVVANEGETNEAIQKNMLSPTKESNNSTYHDFDLKLNVNYSNDFKVIRFKAGINNGIRFGLINSNLIKFATTDTIVDKKVAPTKEATTILTINPHFLLDRDFVLNGLTITPHLGMDGNLKVGLGDKNNVFGDLSLLMGVDTVAHMTDTIDLKIGFNLDTLFKKKIEKFEYDKVKLGGYINLGFRW